ncbi:hypothetical protein L7F22_010601 [Adiantum nelumboides]|nr:hypothetical protein [Adiantum nelumboides]
MGDASFGLLPVDCKNCTTKCDSHGTIRCDGSSRCFSSTSASRHSCGCHATSCSQLRAISDSPAGNSTSFVKAIDKKARSYLKTLERSLTFSAPSPIKDEDPSVITIEFLRARLHAQRAEYKAEKLRAQHLAKKVLELEQQLKLEMARRKNIDLPSMVTDRPNASSYELANGIFDRKDTDGVLVPTNTTSKQGSACKLKRLTCSQSFPHMYADYHLNLKYRDSGKRHTICIPGQLQCIEDATYDEGTSDFITECSSR